MCVGFPMGLSRLAGVGRRECKNCDELGATADYGGNAVGRATEEQTDLSAMTTRSKRVSLRPEEAADRPSHQIGGGAMLAVSPALELAMVLPHGVKGSAYLSASLRQEEEKTYMAAGVMAYRRSPGGIEVLLGRQSLRQGKSRAGTWSFIGGKRDPGENSSAGTAAREACEESMGHVTKDWLAAARLNNPAVLWQPVGSYAVYLAEVERPGTASVSASGVSDLVARLPTGEPLTLTRPHVEESDDATASLAHAHRILDDHGGGPLLLSRFCNTLYERLPSSRDVVKQAGGAQAWCEAHNLHTASGPEETRGQEKVRLARALPITAPLDVARSLAAQG